MQAAWLLNLALSCVGLVVLLGRRILYHSTESGRGALDPKDPCMGLRWDLQNYSHLQGSTKRTSHHYDLLRPFHLLLPPRFQMPSHKPED